MTEGFCWSLENLFKDWFRVFEYSLLGHGFLSHLEFSLLVAETSNGKKTTIQEWDSLFKSMGNSSLICVENNIKQTEFPQKFLTLIGFFRSCLCGNISNSVEVHLKLLQRRSPRYLGSSRCTWKSNTYLLKCELLHGSKFPRKMWLHLVSECLPQSPKDFMILLAMWSVAFPAASKWGPSSKPTASVWRA